MIEFVDPDHKQQLEQQGNSLTNGWGTFPIIGSIPRFVSSDNYSAAFGQQWNTHRVTQLDSLTHTTISRDRLERVLGTPVESLRDKAVLEAGCGAGRFTELLVEAGALVHAVDLSIAVEANLDNVGPHENYCVAQANILKLPFPTIALTQ